MDEIDVAYLRRLISDFDMVFKILENRYSIAHIIFEQAEREWSEGIYKSALAPRQHCTIFSNYLGAVKNATFVCMAVLHKSVSLESHN
jgi:hypothetical protein